MKKPSARVTPVPKQPTISLVGSGAVATALGAALVRANFRVLEVIARDRRTSMLQASRLAKRLRAEAITLENATYRADVHWVLVNDDAIAECAFAMAQRGDWSRKFVFHCSGALGSDILQPLAEAGAYTASVHPMMTFVPGAEPEFTGMPFTLEGDTRAVRTAKVIVSKLGGESFRLPSESKVLYHAMGSFSSPLLIATLTAGEKVGEAAGLSKAATRKLMRSIVQRTMQNFLSSGGAEAFSGPMMRGDVATIRKHAAALRPHTDLFAAYRALVRIAIQHLPVKRAEEIAAIIE